MNVRNKATQAALTAVFACGLTAPALAQSPSWVGTWAVGPQDGTLHGASGTSFNGQTLRQTVFTSIGGPTARIELSNVFGTQPLTISDVHLALPTGGGAVDATTDRQLTFGGQSSTTIPAGGTALSDALPFAVPALGSVTVSMFLPDATAAVDEHDLGSQTNYFVSGDQAGQSSLSGAQTTQNYYILNGLDVQGSSALGAVVTLGASITNGHASTVDANHRWPNDLAARLSQAGSQVGVLNEGIESNELLSDWQGQGAETRFQRDVLSRPGVRWVIFSDEPINDLITAAFFGWTPPTSDQLIAGLQKLIGEAHGAGIKFICSTLTPFGGNSDDQAIRQGYNDFVRQSGNGCDGVVDQDNATHDPQNPTAYLPAYNSGDSLHPNDAGYTAIAGAVDLSFFAPAANVSRSR